jgi:DNA-binding NarL/FixJ family response regulator
MTEMLTVIDWSSLPASEWETLQTIGCLLSEGDSRREIAQKLGLSEGEVSSRIETLKEALLERTGELQGELRARATELRRRGSTV